MVWFQTVEDAVRELLQRAPVSVSRLVLSVALMYSFGPGFGTFFLGTFN